MWTLFERSAPILIFFLFIPQLLEAGTLNEEFHYSNFQQLKSLYNNVQLFSSDRKFHSKYDAISLRSLSDKDILLASAELYFGGTKQVVASESVSISPVLQSDEWIAFALPISGADAPSVLAAVINGALKFRVQQWCSGKDAAALLNWMVIRQGSFVGMENQSKLTIKAEKQKLKAAKGVVYFSIAFDEGETHLFGSPPIVIAQVQSADSIPNSVIIKSVTNTKMDGSIVFQDTAFSEDITLGYVALTNGEIPISDRTSLRAIQSQTNAGVYVSKNKDNFLCGRSAVIVNPFMAKEGLFSVYIDFATTSTVKFENIKCSGTDVTRDSNVQFKLMSLEMTSDKYCEMHRIGDIGLRDINQPTMNPSAHGTVASKSSDALAWIVIGGMVGVATISGLIWWFFKPPLRIRRCEKGETEFPFGGSPSGPLRNIGTPHAY